MLAVSIKIELLRQNLTPAWHGFSLGMDLEGGISW
jgi:hypothetical protein